MPTTKQHKFVARKLAEILNSTDMQKILDREHDIGELTTKLLAYNSPDLFGRKPSPADMEEAQITDLDLSTFLFALSERNAVINIPTYERSGNMRTNTRDRVISKDNRHGKINKLVAHKDFLNFSLGMTDYNVIRDGEKVGAPRTFTVVKHGEWYDGWKRIEFSPDKNEKEFIEKFQLAYPNGSIVFKNFVMPEKRFSVYSLNYFLLKSLIKRLKSDQKYYNDAKADLLEKGFKYPVSGEGAKQDWGGSFTDGKVKSVKTDALNFEVDIPDFEGEYPAYSENQISLVEVTKKARDIQYKVIPALAYHTRCIEYAFYKHNLKHFNEERLPSWISGTSFEEFTPEGKRTTWNRLIYGQRKPGELGFAIRYRLYEKSARVSAET